MRIVFEAILVAILAIVVYSVIRFVGEEVWKIDASIVTVLASIFGPGVIAAYVALKIK